MPITANCRLIFFTSTQTPQRKEALTMWRYVLVLVSVDNQCSPPLLRWASTCPSTTSTWSGTFSGCRRRDTSRSTPAVRSLTRVKEKLDWVKINDIFN